jgi:hypothetical protein
MNVSQWGWAREHSIEHWRALTGVTEGPKGTFPPIGANAWAPTGLVGGMRKPFAPLCGAARSDIEQDDLRELR